MRKIFAIFLALLFPMLSHGALSLQDGKLVEREEIATDSVQEHFSRILTLYEAEDWKPLSKEALIVIKNFEGTPFARESTYFLGVAYFNLADYEMANLQFTEYLTKQATPKYFEEAIQYKFEIAENFRTGARKHLMGFKSMPKWVPANSDALAIYEEVITALPHHELAAHSLYGKAQILSKQQDYRAAIEAYQTLIRRFPKHPLSIESYIGIGQVYLAQCQGEYPDPDYLDLAELNLRKFRQSFPTEEKLSVAMESFVEMQSYFASDLYDTARFYERTGKWGAAKIYYKKILASYPDCTFAENSKGRLEIVEKKLARIERKRSK